MPIKLITLTPLEPYFLGGERIFDIGSNDENKHYFIKSMTTPSQTTLFGTLRFLGIKNPSPIKKLEDIDKKNIGKSSYRLTLPPQTECEKFHLIHGISPLYIVDECTNFYIRTPFDHKDDSHEYSPMKIDCTPRLTDKGERLFPEKNEFNPKSGMTDTWMKLDGSLVKSNDDLFKSVVKTVINKNRSEKAFAKKEYKILEKGYSFAFFADVDEKYYLADKVVYLGQGKSAFQAIIKPVCDGMQGEIESSIEKILRKGMVYAQSDIYCKEDACCKKDLCTMCKFAMMDTRDFRVFVTNYNAGNTENQYSKNQYTKGHENIKLIRAGSVFIPNNIDCFKKKIKEDHANIAGFNKIITGGKE